MSREEYPCISQPSLALLRTQFIFLDWASTASERWRQHCFFMFFLSFCFFSIKELVSENKISAGSLPSFFCVPIALLHSGLLNVIIYYSEPRFICFFRLRPSISLSVFTPMRSKWILPNIVLFFAAEIAITPSWTRLGFQRHSVLHWRSLAGAGIRLFLYLFMKQSLWRYDHLGYLFAAKQLTMLSVAFMIQRTGSICTYTGISLKFCEIFKSCLWQIP